MHKLDLVVNDSLNGEDEDHADWAEARFELATPGPIGTAPFTHVITARPFSTL
ncbi:MAG: hypothetical protein AB1486_14425 [Planctomycetota bacterium]